MGSVLSFLLGSRFSASGFRFLVSSFQFPVSVFGFQFSIMDGDGDCLAMVSVFRFASVASWCRGLGPIIFFVEGESECTSEKARGQFSIFGAVEEMFATDFDGSTRIENFFSDAAVRRMEGLSSVCGGGFGGKCGERGNLLCTGGAQEMQKGSGQWSVVSG
jgi:hypothetical protein